MREILFRGKRKDNGEWVAGSLISFTGSQFTAIFSSPSFSCAVDPETVCQYTGLTDKNGRKIFEGDIIDYNGELGKVVYYNDDAAFDVFFDTWNTDFSVIYNRNTEVVGNIYDNPELLELKQNEV